MRLTRLVGMQVNLLILIISKEKTMVVVDVIVVVGVSYLHWWEMI